MIDLIVADHRHLELMCEQLQAVPSDRLQVLPDLCALLAAHHQAEDSTVYPTVAADSPYGSQTPDERAETVNLARQLREVPPDSRQFEGMLRDLVDLLSGQIEAEESHVLFPLLSLSEAQRRELGAAFARARAALLEPAS